MKFISNKSTTSEIAKNRVGNGIADMGTTRPR